MNLMELKNIKKLDLYLLNLIGMTNLLTHTDTHMCRPWFTWTSCEMWERSPEKQDYSMAQWHTGHENMPLMADSRIQHNTSSNSNQPSPLHTVTGTASARDISCGGPLFGSDVKQVHGSDQFLWWWRVGTLKGGQQIPPKEKRKSKQSSRDVIMVKFRTVAATRWTRKVDFIFQARD